MEHSVDLVWIGNRTDPPSWQLGKVWSVDPVPDRVLEIVQQNLNKTSSSGWLFWDEKLGKPEERRIEETLSESRRIVACGFEIRNVGITWDVRFCEAHMDVERRPPSYERGHVMEVNLKGLFDTQLRVLQRIGFIRPGFQSLEAASLELGHRYVSRGVITRNSPWLISNETAHLESELSLEDEVRILFHRFGVRWTHWALWRAFWTGYAPGSRILSAWRELKQLEKYHISGTLSFRG